MNMNTGITKLCKGLSVVLIGGHLVVQMPSAVSHLALIPARYFLFCYISFWSCMVVIACHFFWDVWLRFCGFLEFVWIVVVWFRHSLLVWFSWGCQFGCEGIALDGYLVEIVWKLIQKQLWEHRNTWPLLTQFRIVSRGKNLIDWVIGGELFLSIYLY